MRPRVLLLCVCTLSWWTTALPQTFVVSAPRAVRVDSSESVLVQLLGATGDVSVYVFLKSSMATDQELFSSDVVTLNAQNKHQAIATVRLFPKQVKKRTKVTLHVQSDMFNKHLTLPVSGSNGFIFVQTDKPLYTPRQSVRVRAFSLNEELRPANRSVFLTFRDPDQQIVDKVEMLDINNGIPSLQNPFKIPLKPKLGLWTIEASYGGGFTTSGKAEFEVKEYVLPSMFILMEPEVSYVTERNFQSFTFKISARYVHGAPVPSAVVYVRFGYVSGDKSPVIIGKSDIRNRLSDSGELQLTVSLQEAFKSHQEARTFDALLGKYLYIAVLLYEERGGISQEAELATVKFVKSPYSLKLVSTPPFIKPGLPYNIQVLVRDYQGQPVRGVPVQLVEGEILTRFLQRSPLSCTSSQSHAIAYFICNPPANATRATLKFATSDPALPLASQASLPLKAEAYVSPDLLYLYIDPPSGGLQVGYRANVRVYSATPPNHPPISTLSFMVLSRGRVLAFGRQNFPEARDSRHMVSFDVSPQMAPSVRLLVFYAAQTGGATQLVADSLWLDVTAKCMNGLETEVSAYPASMKPKSSLNLRVKTNQEGLVALSAVDSALLSLRHAHQDPVTKVLRHVEHSDLGCGGGGGKDVADVFRLAGLTFLTNANAHPADTDESCTMAVRAKRQLAEEQKKKALDEAGLYHQCCDLGWKHVPSSITCEQLTQQKFKKQDQTIAKVAECRKHFLKCCKLQSIAMDTNTLGRVGMGEGEDVPSLVRSYFPESWLWEVQRIRPGTEVFKRTLPDSLTTWSIRAVGVFKNGLCVAEPLPVSVSQPVSINVPLPYKLVRGEQLELRGSVYNQSPDTLKYCVVLAVGPAICLLQAQVSRGGAERSTPCVWRDLPGEGVASVAFTLLALEPGEHELTFTLKGSSRTWDVLVKTLLVVPEGVKTEEFAGGRLDPQALYGQEKLQVHIKNRLPSNLVPQSSVERQLFIQGQLFGDILSVIDSPDGLKKLINVPSGSAEAELATLLPLIYSYRYLETTQRWGLLGKNIQETAKRARQFIKTGLVDLTSFRSRTGQGQDMSYSMWKGREPSTWITALTVKAVSQLEGMVPIDHQALAQSVAWLIRDAQKPDGSFRESSSFKPNKVMAGGASELDQSICLASFVLIGLKKATQIKVPTLQLKYQEDSINKAADYISQHALGVQSVYVRAVATYALTLHDTGSEVASDLYSSLETLAQEKGHPVQQRYWQEGRQSSEHLKPDETSSLTVETTAYVLLTAVLKGHFDYARPILSWLTQDQNYGGGFYSVQDTVLTLEALTDYTSRGQDTDLHQDIRIRYSRKGLLGEVELRRDRPVATPIQVMKSDDITVSTGYGTGVSDIKLKTVYYQTTSSTQRCNFELTIEVKGADPSRPVNERSPHLVACVKYRPPPNEIQRESGLTVLEIQLPTGLQPNLEDLRPFSVDEDPVVSHYELIGSTVVIQMESVPLDIFLCISFRVRVEFRVGAASNSLFTVFEPQDPGSRCTKQFSDSNQKLQSLCVDEHCQCMTATCARYRAPVDADLTIEKRLKESCVPHITYVYKVQVKSSRSEGDFVVYSTTVQEVLRHAHPDLQGVKSGVEVELVRKTTCSSLNLQKDGFFLLMGASVSEITQGRTLRYRFPLDSEALVEPWPNDSEDLQEYSLDLQLYSCP